MFIQTEDTPNPQVLKFLPGRDVLGEGSREFTSAGEAHASPLAAALFALDGVARVFFGADFLTVTRAPDAPTWPQMKAPVLAAIMEHYTSGAPIVIGCRARKYDDSGDYDGETAQIVPGNRRTCLRHPHPPRRGAGRRGRHHVRPLPSPTPAAWSGSACAGPAPAAPPRPPP